MFYKCFLNDLFHESVTCFYASCLAPNRAFLVPDLHAEQVRTGRLRQPSALNALLVYSGRKCESVYYIILEF